MVVSHPSLHPYPSPHPDYHGHHPQAIPTIICIRHMRVSGATLFARSRLLIGGENQFLGLRGGDWGNVQSFSMAAI
jgi:hypothetical protein